MNENAKHARWILKSEHEINCVYGLIKFRGSLADMSFFGEKLVLLEGSCHDITAGEVVEVEVPFFEPMSKTIQKRVVNAIVRWCKRQKMGLEFRNLLLEDPALFDGIERLILSEGILKIAKKKSPQC